MIWPLGVLNRGTERRGSDEERTPSSSNRARRRTKLEVHGDARTRPESERLRKRKETPSRTFLGPLLSPFKAPSGVRARDGRELSDTERAAFAKCVHFAQRCGQASVADVCKEWGISKSHGYRILNRWRTEESVQSRPRSGRPRALTQEDMKMLESLSEEVKGYFTWESITKRFTERTGKRVSCTTVFNSCKTAGWRQVCERYVPCLSATDVARRLEWAKQHVGYTWTGTENLRYPNVLNKKVGWVDIDEKWWDMLKKRLMKVHPGHQGQTRVATKSKRFVQKVMGLCAVARPCGDFNGRLGMYRCARKKVAQRNSKYHKRGDVYDDDCEVDGDMFYEIVTTQLFPDIYEKMADFDVVFVQMDNARPHVKRILDLKVAGKRRKRIDGKQMPLIKFVLQPANSPDTNLNDLCFFRSLSKFVQEHEREIEHSAANKDKFWNLIVEQYHEYHDRERLERCWDVKTAVTKCILDANGKNDYKLPHGIKHEEPISVDLPFDSDDINDPVARTLDYEGLHASLPSSLPR